jgi:hypothetical protein
MTDRAQPGAIDSIVRNDELGEAISAFSEGAIVAGTNPTNASIRRNDIDETVLDAFSISTSSNSLDVTISEGEGYVEGWFCRDVTTTLTLPTNATTDIVVGYNTDAVFDPNSDPDRDAADEVIVDLQQNVDPDVPQVVAHRVETDGSGVTSTERVAPVGSLNLRGLKSPTLTDASDRKRPTAQLQSRSALSAPTNAESVVFQRAPVNDEAAQGTESVLTLLQSGIDPAMVMRRELDGQGGAYSHQLDAALGRFARLNANLSFEFDSISDLPFFSTASSGSNFTFNLTDRPRRVRVSHDGSGSNESGGIRSSVLVSEQSLNGGFRLTFSDVEVSQNNTDNTPFIGLSTVSGADVDLNSNGSNILYRVNSGTSQLILRTPTGGAARNIQGSVNQTVKNDITLEYDGAEVSLFVNGILQADEAFSFNADFSPIIQLDDVSGNTTGEFIEVGQITVEPIGESF